jgi:hypothetical protein
VTRPRSAATLGAALLLAIAVGACGGGGGGLASKPPATILRESSRAAGSLRSVHIAGTISKNGTLVGLDLRLRAGVGAEGWVAESSKRIQMVVDRGTVYISAAPSFWTSYGNATVARLMKGRWLKAAATGNYATFAQFGSLRDIFGAMFKQHGRLAKTGTRTIRGTKAIGLRDERQGGVVYVALSGKPYPLELANAGGRGKGSTSGRLTFSDFNAKLTIEPPRHAIDLQQLQKLARG